MNVVNSLTLLQQNHKWHDLYGEQIGSISNGGAVLQDGFKEFIEDQLVSAAQRLVERLQFRNLVEGELCGRRKSAAHTCYRSSGCRACPGSDSRVRVLSATEKRAGENFSYSSTAISCVITMTGR